MQFSRMMCASVPVIEIETFRNLVHEYLNRVTKEEDLLTNKKVVI